MSEETKRILELVAEGKIDAEQAERLLSALGDESGETGNGDSRPSESEATGEETESERVVVTVEASGKALVHDDTFDVGAEASLVVKTTNVAVRVKAGDQGKVRVQADLSPEQADGYKVTQVGDTIDLVVKEGKRDRSILGRLLGERGSIIEATVPRSTALDVVTVNGKVTASGIGRGSSLRTTNGAIDGEDLAEEVQAKSTNGAVSLRRVEGPVFARTTNGRIVTDDVRGNVDSKTVNGAIRCRMETVPGASYRLRTSNGAAKVVLIGDPNIKVEALTDMGGLNNGLRFDKVDSGKRGMMGHRLSGTIGGGESELYVSTKLGAISLQQEEGE